MELKSMFFLLVNSVPTLPSLKIMVHSDFGSRSHVKPILEIRSELQKRQHSIIYAAVEDNKRFLKGFFNISFISLGVNEELKEILKQPNEKNIDKVEMDPIKVAAVMLGKIFPLSYQHVYQHLTEVVDNEKPDVIICDFFSPACRDIAEMHEVPLISGFQSTDLISIIDAKILTNDLRYRPITTETLSFIERFYDAIILPLRTRYHFQPLLNGLNQLRSQFGIPESNQIYGDLTRTLGIANTFVGFEPALPTPPNIKQVGPIVSSSIIPLTGELETFLEKHKRTIYIAFGSGIMLEHYDIENIVMGSLEALEKDSIDGIIWGLGSTKRTDFPEYFQHNEITLNSITIFNHPQFRILEWAPQEAILNHTNTVLFISHGGLESTFEAILSKTPIVCMAFFNDQPRNAKKIELAGIGTYINRFTMNPSTVANKIKNLLQDPTISNNLKRMYSLAKQNGRINYAADLIETYTNNAKLCRPYQPYTYGQPACEAAHLIPASYKLSYLKASQLDVYSIALIITCCLAGFILYQLYTGFKKLVASAIKIKPD